MMRTSVKFMVVTLVMSLGASAVWGQFGLGDLKKAAKEVEKAVGEKDKDKDKEADKDKTQGSEKAESGAAAEPAAAPAGPIGPIVLDKWSRYHTNITIYEKAGRTADGSTDYNNFVWVPKMDVVVQMTDPEDDDIVIIQHYKGDKEWGKAIKKPAANITKRDGKNYSLVTVSSMMDESEATSETGAFSVKVSYKQVGLGKLHENLATYVYTVKNCNNGWTSKGQIKGFYVDHDFRLGEAWLYRTSDGNIHLWTWFKYDRKTEELVRNGRMRCYGPDKKFKFHDNPTRRTENTHENYTSQKDHTQTNWGLWYWWVPRVEGVPAGDFLRSNPGDYRCVLTQDGDISREFYFTVGADGEIVREPFPGQETIYAVEDSFPLKMVVKESVDLEYDAEAFEKGMLYGRK